MISCLEILWFKDKNLGLEQDIFGGFVSCLLRQETDNKDNHSIIDETQFMMTFQSQLSLDFLFRR